MRRHSRRPFERCVQWPAGASDAMVWGRRSASVRRNRIRTVGKRSESREYVFVERECGAGVWGAHWPGQCEALPQARARAVGMGARESFGPRGGSYEVAWKRARRVGLWGCICMHASICRQAGTPEPRVL